MAAVEEDIQLQTLAHGVITLEQSHRGYGAERRRLRVLKYRGMQFRGGYHDFIIQTGGLRVFPRLVAAEHRHATSRELLSSGVPQLDSLMGGGIECGTSTLIVGAAGSGKSTIATQFATNTAASGKRAAMFVFDESVETLIKRAKGLGIEVDEQIVSGRLLVQPVDPAEMSPGQFAQQVADAVHVHKVSLIVIDSLNGYLNSMPEEHFLTVQLHELLIVSRASRGGDHSDRSAPGPDRLGDADPGRCELSRRRSDSDCVISKRTAKCARRSPS